MRYLRKINEFRDAKSVKELCNSYLAYLLDNGYDTRVTESFEDINIIFYSNKHIEGDRVLIKWVDIVDDFLPFLEVLSNTYNITNIKFSSLYPYKYALDRNGNPLFEPTVSQILNNDIPQDISFLSLTIFIY
jgi:hypothetical protein